MKIRLPSITGVTGQDCPNAGSFAEFRVTGFSESLLQMSVVCLMLTCVVSWPFPTSLCSNRAPKGAVLLARFECSYLELLLARHQRLILPTHKQK